MGSRISVCIAAAVGAAAVVWPTAAVAGSALVLEVHEGARSEGAARAMAPAVRELAAAGFVAGEHAARSIEARVSRPMVPTSTARAGQLFALASAHLRRGREGDAERVMLDLVRRFPAAEPSRHEHGRDTVELHRRLRRQAERAGRGRLVVEVSDPHAVVFIDDGFRGVGRVDETVAAGRHRVHAQIGKRAGRVHEVLVRADAVTRVRVPWKLDRALRTARDWAGLVLPPGRAAVEHAAALARAAGADVVVLAIDRSGGHPVLIGAAIDARSGRVVRRARAALDGDAEEEAAALGRSLAGAHVNDRQPRESSGAWLKWSLAGASMLGLGAGATLIHLDGRCRERVYGRPCPVTWQTAGFGWAALGAGVALGAASASFFWRDARSSDSRIGLALVPRADGAAVTAGLQF